MAQRTICTRSNGTARAVPPSRTCRRAQVARRRRVRSSIRRPADDASAVITTRARTHELPPSPAASDGRANRSWRSSGGKCTRRQRYAALAFPRGDPLVTAPAKRRAEFRRRTLRSHSFASKRFHVLLNSLFKVLFNFPSRYLSAIGLLPVFSLRWSLPPALGCIHKQPDSREAQSDRPRRRRGLTPAMGRAPIRRTRTSRPTTEALPNTTAPAAATARDSVLGPSHFTRRYWGNPGWFLFLRLVICLNSAGNLVRSQVEV